MCRSSQNRYTLVTFFLALEAGRKMDEISLSFHLTITVFVGLNLTSIGFEPHPLRQSMDG